MKHSDAVEVENGICIRCGEHKGPMSRWWEGPSTKVGYLCFRCLIKVLKKEEAMGEYEEVDEQHQIIEKEAHDKYGFYCHSTYRALNRSKNVLHEELESITNMIAEASQELHMLRTSIKVLEDSVTAMREDKQLLENALNVLEANTNCE